MSKQRTPITFCIFTGGIRDFSKFHGKWSGIQDQAEVLVSELDKLIETREKTIQKVAWTFTEPKEFGTTDPRLVTDPHLIGEVVVTTLDDIIHTVGDIYVKEKSISKSPAEIFSALFPS